MNFLFQMIDFLLKIFFLKENWAVAVRLSFKTLQSLTIVFSNWYSSYLWFDGVPLDFFPLCC